MKALLELHPGKWKTILENIKSQNKKKLSALLNTSPLEKWRILGIGSLVLNVYEDQRATKRHWGARENQHRKLTPAESQTFS